MTPLQKTAAPLFLLLAAAGAWACYDPAGSGQCGPNGIGPRNPDAYGSGAGGYVPSYTPPIGYYESSEYYLNRSSSSSDTPPSPVRESRYGAFAIYANHNGLWDSRTMFTSVISLSSKESARKMALQACNQKSGHTCQVYDYANQCLSVTTGEVSEVLKIFSALSPQPGQAPLDAMQQCTAAQGKDCEFVVQEECSLPE